MTSDRLSCFSVRMASITLCLIVGMLVLNGACWFFPQLNSVEGGYGLGFGLTNQLISNNNVNVAAFSWWQKIGAIVLSSIPLAILAKGLWHLRALFLYYSHREFFSTATASHLGKVGRAVGFWVVARFICEPLLGVWASMLNSPGNRFLTLTFGSSDIVALFLAASIAIVAHILRQASELASEHRQFV